MFDWFVFSYISRSLVELIFLIMLLDYLPCLSNYCFRTGNLEVYFLELCHFLWKWKLNTCIWLVLHQNPCLQIPALRLAFIWSKCIIPCWCQSAGECETWQLGRRVLVHSISFPLCSVIIFMYQHVEFLTINIVMSRHSAELYFYGVE